ncbi:MAG: aspartate kinase [Candidatus Helarchaeota archaeon]
MKKLIVHKFGGSCLKNSQSFEKTLKIIEKFRGKNMIFVCSALSKTTDYLLETAEGVAEQQMDVDSRIASIRSRHLNLINEVIQIEPYREETIQFIDATLKRLSNTLYGVWEIGLTERSLNFILSVGERLSTFIYYMYLKSKNEPVEFFSGDTIVFTNSTFNNALPHFELTETSIQRKVEPILQEGKYAVVTGYISSSKDGHVTTLGRGGSDLTATLLAYSIPNMDTTVILWKDVDGLLTANPTLEPKAKLIRNISYAEARELAFFGSKILHPLCIFPMEKRRIPIQLRNFNNPDNEAFTSIQSTQEKITGIVKAITVQHASMITVEGDAMVSLPGVLAKVFDVLGDTGVNIIMVSQGSSENNITFMVDRKSGEKAKESLRMSKFFGDQWFNIKVESDISILAIVGAGMAYTPGVAGRIFTALGNAKVNVRAIAQGSSEINISIAIDSQDVQQGVHAIHQEFKLGE